MFSENEFATLQQRNIFMTGAILGFQISTIQRHRWLAVLAPTPTHTHTSVLLDLTRSARGVPRVQLLDACLELLVEA